jgi:hypothetical protein
MERETWVLLGGLHSLGFAAFHLGFWRLFGWPRTLASTTVANRAVLQIANLQLVVVFLGVGVLCLAMPAQLAGTSLGRAILAGMTAFWLVRLVGQWIWLRIDRPLVHVLTALFAVGVVVFAIPALS